jgi:FkbM family methyltransferase
LCYRTPLGHHGTLEPHRLMANPYWKRVEKSAPYKKTKLLVKRLSGKELWLRQDVRIPTKPYGDWRIDTARLNRDSTVYSLGVGDNIDLDLGLVADIGCHVHAFDPTPSTAAWLADAALPPLFHFHPWAVTAADGTMTLYPRVKKDGTLDRVMYTLVPEDAARGNGIDVTAVTLATAMKSLNHARIDLLKMDIEGAEYEVLESVLTLDPLPTQLLVEFHHRFPGIGVAKTAAIVGRLRDAGYCIMGIAVSGREISFIRERSV